MNISDDREQVRRLLIGSRRIAVVGCSPKPERESHAIARFLIEKGYEVIPVNPGHDKILGRQCWPDVASIPGKVDIVDVFRSAEHTPPIATEAVEAKAEAFWLQSGIVNEEAERIADAAGLYVVMDRCIATLHRMLIRDE